LISSLVVGRLAQPRGRVKLPCEGLSCASEIAAAKTENCITGGSQSVSCSVSCSNMAVEVSLSYSDPGVNVFSEYAFYVLEVYFDQAA
jgi:hypothetical protein